MDAEEVRVGRNRRMKRRSERRSDVIGRVLPWELRGKWRFSHRSVLWPVRRSSWRLSDGGSKAVVDRKKRATNKVRFLVLFGGLLLGVVGAHAEPREILQAVSQDQAERLEQYNSVFLQRELYSAARHRIVSANTALLLRDEAIAIRPFDDVAPIVLTPERVQRTDTYVDWLGRIRLDDPALEALGAKFYVSITMLWWDVNDNRNAELSGSSRFKFSPVWKIDENGEPFLEPQRVAPKPSVIGPPPKTPEEVAEHKRLLALHRRAFGSFSARLELPTGQTYVVTPLPYTPRYSVVYELDKDKVVPVPFESEDEAFLTEEDREKVRRYEAFRKSLPIESKAIRGDLQ